MWKHMKRWFAVAAAMFAVVGMASEAGARGGRRGRGSGSVPGGGRGSRGGRGGRGGPSAGRGGRGRTGAGSRSAKEWELIQEQEERLAMVKERREHLMDIERKEAQEKWLSEKRQSAADAASRTEDVR